jgi:hypothetical protein
MHEKKKIFIKNLFIQKKKQTPKNKQKTGQNKKKNKHKKCSEKEGKERARETLYVVIIIIARV